MKKKTIIIITALVLAAVVAVVILTSNGEKVKPLSPEEIQNPELNAPGISGPADQSTTPTSTIASETSSGATETETNGDSPTTPTSSDPQVSSESADSTEGTPNEPTAATTPQETSRPTAPAPSDTTNSPTQNTPESSTTSGTYRITFVDRDNSVLSTQTVKEGGSVVPPIPPTHDGVVFLKWDTVLTDIRADRTIKAVYLDVPAFTIAVENVYIDASQKTVSVKVSLYNNPGLSSLFLNLTYPEGLKLQKIDFDRRFGEYVTAVEPYNSPQSISMISPFSDICESGVFATLTFSIDTSINLNQLTISLSYDQDNTFNSSYEDVGITVLDGTITKIS